MSESDSRTDGNAAIATFIRELRLHFGEDAIAVAEAQCAAATDDQAGVWPAILDGLRSGLDRLE